MKAEEFSPKKALSIILPLILFLFLVFIVSEAATTEESTYLCQDNMNTKTKYKKEAKLMVLRFIKSPNASNYTVAEVLDVIDFYIDNKNSFGEADCKNNVGDNSGKLISEITTKKDGCGNGDCTGIVEVTFCLLDCTEALNLQTLIESQIDTLDALLTEYPSAISLSLLSTKLNNIITSSTYTEDQIINYLDINKAIFGDIKDELVIVVNPVLFPDFEADYNAALADFNVATLSDINDFILKEEAVFNVLSSLLI